MAQMREPQARLKQRMHRRRAVFLLCGIILAAAAGLLLLPRPAPARAMPRAASHSYLVNSTLDEPDGDPSDGTCASFPSGVCTLRAAVMDANFSTGPHTITLPAATFVLTRTGIEDNALSGDLDIKQSMTIQGAGAGATIVDGNGSVTNDRVFQMLSSATYVTMTGMTIRNGNSFSGGGGIYRDASNCSCSVTPSLYLSGIVLENNKASNGGGLNSIAGLVVLNNTILHGNSANNSTGYGGGVYAYSGTVTIQDSQVYSNSAFIGGGLALGDVHDSHIVRTEIYSDTANTGGGMFNYASSNLNSRVTLQDSYLHHNQGTCCGGAIDSQSTLTVLRTTIDANSAVFRGGGIEGTGTSVPSTMLVDQSTISNNSSKDGGGIYFALDSGGSSLLTLLNSTVSGNAAGGGTGGGGIFVRHGPLQLLNATIAGNHVSLGGGPGGGVYITATATLTALNSLIANNWHNRNIILGPVPDDCFSLGTVGELAYNLILTNTNCFVSGPQGGNVVGQDPRLGPLQNNGGSTQTRALLTGSPALDAGAPTGCTGAGGAPLTRDQRGFRRPYGAGCDIGAYERGAFLFLPLVMR